MNWQNFWIWAICISIGATGVAWLLIVMMFIWFAFFNMVKAIFI